MLALLPRLLLAVTVAELALAGPFGDLDLLPFGVRSALPIMRAPVCVLPDPGGP